MKRGTGVAAAVLALMAPLAGCDGAASEAEKRAPAGVVERIREVLGADRAGPGVVATVDGVPIYLRQVEGLYDMSSLTPDEGRTVTLDEVRADYAACLRTLIGQALIRKELAARGLSVSEEDVRRLEEAVSSGYDERPGPDFDRWIEDVGLVPDLWRGQLRARLELERWQAELARSVTVDEPDVEAYVAAHPGEMVVPAQVEYLLVSGAGKAAVENARKSGLSDPAALRDKGMEVNRYRRSVGGVPDVWAGELTALAPGAASTARETGGAWRYVVLLDKQPERPRSPAEIYAYAEQRLMEQRLPGAFDAWLADALSRATIRMAEPLLPRNAPRPAPRPAPRASARPAGDVPTGTDVPVDMPDAVGETEADREP